MRLPVMHVREFFIYHKRTLKCVVCGKPVEEGSNNAACSAECESRIEPYGHIAA